MGVELIAVIFMLVAGLGIAVFLIAAISIAQREEARHETAGGAPDRDRLATSLLAQILILGGTAGDEALRLIRRQAGLAAPVTGGIDISNWGEAYAQTANAQQRAWLLETAVQLIANRNRPVPLRQYSALLDLSFALGFQTDALAKLREQYGFDYVDHARNGRPREADRVGGATPLFVREKRDPGDLLRVLEIEGSASRQLIISAYRRLAAQHHPDRYFGQPQDVQSTAAARFIEITRAYETLLGIYRD